MDEAVAQVVALGLVGHPAFVLTNRSGIRGAHDPDEWTASAVAQAAQKAHANVALYGRIARTDSGLLLQPRVLILADEQTTESALQPIRIPQVDFLATIAILPGTYANALKVRLPDRERTRMDRAALPTSSEQALSLFTRGQIAFHRGHNEDAIGLLQRATEVDGNFIVAQYTLGAVHQALGNRWKAAAQFYAATKLDATYPEPYKALGDLFLAAPRPMFDQAVKAYQAAIDRRPFYADAHVGLGDATAAQRDVSAATAAYQDAIRFNPFHAGPYLRLGRVYADTGRCGDALKAYRLALELDPDSTEAQRGLQAVGDCRQVPAR